MIRYFLNSEKFKSLKVCGHFAWYIVQTQITAAFCRIQPTLNHHVWEIFRQFKHKPRQLIVQFHLHWTTTFEKISQARPFNNFNVIGTIFYNKYTINYIKNQKFVEIETTNVTTNVILHTWFLSCISEYQLRLRLILILKELYLCGFACVQSF